MSIFKENLTSKLLQEASIKVVNHQNSISKILELGCGDGNISKYVLKNQKKINILSASDISKKAIKVAKQNFEQKINFKTGDLFSPWKDEKFNIIISDVSSINDQVAFLSPWYKNIKCSCGQDGLNNIKNILTNIDKHAEKKCLFILPIISLCNTSKLYKLLKRKFKKVLLTKKKEWPLPKFFEENITQFKILKIQKKIEFRKKFGIYIAYTRVAICKL
jgi:ubiquinone/menaquinone biosynthesis C-methylase UbiE